MGIYRTFLALLVVVTHLAGGFGTYAGPVAVFAFYTLSGYLITRVVQRTYSNGIAGLGAFAINRFLRLYPSYWVVTLVSLAIVLAFPRLAMELNDALQLPRGKFDTLAQVTIIGLHKIYSLNHSRLVPTAWSLNIEIVYYALIAVLLGRTRWIALGWWVVSLGLMSVMALRNDVYGAYFTMWGPSLCFATGSIAHHFLTPRKEFSGVSVALRVLPFGLIFALAFAVDAGLNVPNLALILAAIPATVLAIFALQARWKAPSLQRIDDVMADLSYPIFLAHWPLAVLVSGMLLGSTGLGLPLFLVTLPVTILFAAAVNVLVEAPVRALRSKVRQVAADSTAPQALSAANSIAPPSG
jgi:peptidoglycan/LPS O-acetylase OafA/YrhL